MPKRTADAERRHRLFRDKFTQLDRALRSEPLEILVWGPGPKNDEFYNKRCQILNELCAAGHAAVFSEDVEHEDNELGPAERELTEALSADLIVILPVSSGPQGELLEYGRIAPIALKMCVIIPNEWKANFLFQGPVKMMLMGHESLTYMTKKKIWKCGALAEVRHRIPKYQYLRVKSNLETSNIRD